MKRLHRRESELVTEAWCERQIERFYKYLMPEPNSGCWLWIGAVQPRRHGGYGVFQSFGGRKTNSAHLFAYRLLRGEIRVGLELDHLCRNTQCVNPDHLEAVPRRVNLLRGNTLVAINAGKTHCPKGHAYDGDNVSYSFTKTGTLRGCRACRRAQARAYYWKKRGGHPQGDFALPRRYRRGGVAHKRWGRFESLQRPDEVHPVRVSGVE